MGFETSVQIMSSVDRASLRHSETIDEFQSRLATFWSKKKKGWVYTVSCCSCAVGRVNICLANKER